MYYRLNTENNLGVLNCWTGFPLERVSLGELLSVTYWSCGGVNPM